MSTKHAERCPTCGRRQKRSNPQNARYWVLLHVISERCPVEGNLYSADTWHLWARSKFLGCSETLLPSGRTLILPRSTTTLDVGEFNDFMTRLEAWAAEQDVYLDEIFETQ